MRSSQWGGLTIWKSWQLSWIVGWESPFYLFRSSSRNPFQVIGSVGSSGGESTKKISLVEKIVLVERGETHSH